jgi:transposase-like protein
MPRNESKWGYCRNCVKNVPHDEWHTSPWFRFVDNMTFGKLRLLRVGPWHCVHCQSQSFYLRRTLDDAVDYPIQGTEFDLREPQASEQVTAHTVGNFIRTEESLVMRSQRLKRFSEKYRDAVVRRILKGTATMMQIRQEMDVSEKELVDWISDLVDRLQARLATKENGVQSQPSLRIVNETSDAEIADRCFRAGGTVDGKVRPK